MNKYLWISMTLFLLSGSRSASGQIVVKGLDQLSPGVRSAFVKKYSDTREESWSRVDQSIVISFRSGNDYYDAFFDNKGQWQKTETAIVFGQLPDKIRVSLSTGEFRNWKKGSVFKVEVPESEGYYRICLYSGNWDELEVNFDRSGRRIN